MKYKKGWQKWILKESKRRSCSVKEAAKQIKQELDKETELLKQAWRPGKPGKGDIGLYQGNYIKELADSLDEALLEAIKK